MTSENVNCDKCQQLKPHVSPQPPKERWCNDCIFKYPQERKKLMKVAIKNAGWE